MKSPWTISHLEKLKAAGKIRDYAYEPPKKKQLRNLQKKGDGAKRWISKNLYLWCKEDNLLLQEEKEFNSDRKWRFDWAIPELMIAIEYEGIFSDISRHTTARGYTGDAEKYNSAQALGWKVLRFTAMNYKTLITELNKHRQ